MKLPSRIDIYEARHFLREFLKDESNLSEDGNNYIKKITGYNLVNASDFDEILRFFKDDSVLNSALEDYYQFKTRKIKENVYDRTSHTVSNSFRGLKHAVMIMLHNSISFTLVTSHTGISTIHTKLFGEEFKNEGLLEDNSDRINYDELSFQTLRMFTNSVLYHSDSLISILNYCIDYTKLKSLDRHDEECWNCVDRKNLRKLLKLICPTTYDTMKIILKNKVNIEQIKRGELGKFINKFGGDRYCVEFNTRIVENTFFHSLMMVAILELKMDEFVDLFSASTFINHFYIYTNQCNTFRPELIIDKYDKEEIPKALLNRHVRKVLEENNKRNGLMSIDGLIDGFTYGPDETRIDAKNQMEGTVRALNLNFQSSQSKFLKNKAHTFKKFINGEEVNVDFFSEFVQTLMFKTLAVTHLNDLQDNSCCSQKKQRIREAMMILHNSGYLKGSTDVVNISTHAIQDCSKYAFELYDFCKENNITEEVFFIMMLKISTLQEEYCSLTVNSLKHKQRELSASEFQTRKENEELKNEIERLKEEIEKMKEENSNIKSSVHKEVERRTEELYLSNYRLEREVEELKEDRSNLNSKYENLLNAHNELHTEYEELLNKTDEDDEEDLTDMLSYLKSRRIAIAGGYPRVLQALERMLPDIYVIPKEGPSMNIKSLDNNDLVIVYTPFMSHGFAYGIKANTTFDERYLKIDKRINAHEVIRRAYNHMKTLESQRVSTNPLE